VGSPKTKPDFHNESQVFLFVEISTIMAIFQRLQLFWISWILKQITSKIDEKSTCKKIPIWCNMVCCEVEKVEKKVENFCCLQKMWEEFMC